MTRLQCCILLSAFVFVGCLSSKVSSIKTTEVTPKLTRLFITFQSPSESSGFISSLAVDLKSELGKHSVKSTLHIDNLGPLSLESDEDILSKNMSSCKLFDAEGVMVIEQKENRSIRGITTGTTLRISLYLTNNNKPIWRSLLTVDRVSIFPNLEKATALAVVKKLQSDQIIL